MLGGACSAACKPCNPSTDVVKVDVAKLAGACSAPAAEQLSEQQQLAAALTARLEEVRAEREREEARERAQERQRSLDAAEAARQAEEERIREQVRLAEKERKQKEADASAARHKASMEAVAEEQKRLRIEQESLEKLEERSRLASEFLKQHAFAGINSAKRSLMGSTYPLHKAAELGDARMVAILMQEGADQNLKNSWGKTAADVAQKCNKGYSHAMVIEALGVADTCAPSAGGA